MHRLLLLLLVVGLGLVVASPAYGETATAYDCSLDGNYTSSGDIYECMDYTVATYDYPFGTHLLVCYEACAEVVVTDTGGFGYGHYDLSWAAGLATGIAPFVGFDDVSVYYLYRDPWDYYQQY
jgi:rare lipoprotein A (peptidoglycan hydrolase)